ncbi:MAG TPA: transcriptional regulator [Clostridiales bacterium]|nr:transcriptional regulator [Clostridiales bacterium]HBJ98281.1 transcriptional regulator [Clostridiales bacterium]
MANAMLLDKKTQEMVVSYVPNGEVISDLACFFSVFADETRLKILSALSISEMCVTDVSQVLCINQTTVSHQLRLLKNIGAVKIKRQGKVIFYSLRTELINDILLKGVEFLGF